ncbi:MAG: lipid II flippase MurJ [Bifidobacterium sp.]
MALATSFTLWCMPQIFFYGLYTVVGQILRPKTISLRMRGVPWVRTSSAASASARSSRYSAVPPSIRLILDRRQNRLTAGTWTLGVAFQALVLFIPLTKIGLKYRPIFGLRGIGLRSMGPVAAWSVGIVVIDQLANIVITRTSTNAPMLAQRSSASIRSTWPAMLHTRTRTRFTCCRIR